MSELKSGVWEGCFKEGWKNLLCKDGFRHPAKFNYGVVVRIVDELRDSGVLRPGSVVFDPFGGVGTGGVVCATRGYEWVGVEVEPRFVEIGHRNFDLHVRKWRADRKPIPALVQGDSRLLFRFRGEADVVVGSPPTMNSLDDGRREGSGGHGEAGRRGRDRATSDQGYGNSPGQLCSEEMASAVMSSPPYWSTRLDQNVDPEGTARRMRREGYSEREIAHITSNAMTGHYGTSNGQLSTDANFWAGASMVVDNCHRILAPGGVAVWVVRNWVKEGKLVEFSCMWADLCVSRGFKVDRRVYATNSIRWEEEVLFGEPIKRATDWKSFFRRMAEKKGAPPVDWDDIIFMSKKG